MEAFPKAGRTIIIYNSLPGSQSVCLSFFRDPEASGYRVLKKLQSWGIIGKHTSLYNALLFLINKFQCSGYVSDVGVIRQYPKAAAVYTIDCDRPAIPDYKR